MSKTIDILQELCSIDGVSGYEDKVRDYIKKQVEDCCDTSIDARGNLICFKKGKHTPLSKIMLSAHMDEVGFIVTYIESSGLIRISNIGGIDTRIAVGKPIILESGVPGVIGAKPIHLLESGEIEKTLSMDDLYIDIGACSKEDAEKDVSVGDMVVFSSNFQKLGTHKLKGRAMDDRAGCAALITLLQRDLKYDVYVVFTTLEEVGGASAGNAAFRIQPDIGIIVETTCSADVPNVSESEQLTTQGDGPSLTFKDGKTVYDMGLYKKAMKIAKKKEIPCQAKRGVSGGNESRFVQDAANGARVLAVSIPGRYIHSPSCVIDKRDIKNTIHLLEALVSDFGASKPQDI